MPARATNLQRITRTTVVPNAGNASAFNFPRTSHTVSGELALTTPTAIDEDALRRLERTVLPSAPVAVIVHIGRWCLNYKKTP